MTEAKMKKSYYSRFQVKQKRRRQGKTDYAKRRKLLRQDTNLYGVYKSRLVVRVTCSKVICQIFKPSTQGDICLVRADSTELKEYGIKFGLTNYSASYLTGLLCGLRAIEKVNLTGKGFGAENQEIENVGKYNVQEDQDEDEYTKAYECVLDIGLARASKGAKVFGAMKGVSDAGVRVPHNPKKFYGYEEGDSKKNYNFDDQAMKNRILGVELMNYMISLRDNDTEKFKKQFSVVSSVIKPEDIPKAYENAIEAIRKDWKKKEKNNDFDYSTFKRFKVAKKTKEEKEKIIREKIQAIKSEN